MPPVAIGRINPNIAFGGRKLKDGYRSLVTFAAAPGVLLWEKTVTPLGFEGGDAIETTTMHNVVFRTFHPRRLITATEHKFEGAYEPRTLSQLRVMLNKPQNMTTWFPNGWAWAYYAFLKTFEPGDLAEGDFPMATCTIVPTNVDPLTDLESGVLIFDAQGNVVVKDANIIAAINAGLQPGFFDGPPYTDPSGDLLIGGAF